MKLSLLSLVAVAAICATSSAFAEPERITRQPPRRGVPIDHRIPGHGGGQLIPNPGHDGGRLQPGPGHRYPGHRDGHVRRRPPHRVGGSHGGIVWRGPIVRPRPPYIGPQPIRIDRQRPIIDCIDDDRMMSYSVSIDEIVPAYGYGMPYRVAYVWQTDLRYRNDFLVASYIVHENPYDGVYRYVDMATGGYNFSLQFYVNTWTPGEDAFLSFIRNDGLPGNAEVNCINGRIWR